MGEIINKDSVFGLLIKYYLIQIILIFEKAQTLGVWPDNPSISALVELIAKYILQTLPRIIFEYYYDQVTCEDITLLDLMLSFIYDLREIK